jgi:hypothetical protein
MTTGSTVRAPSTALSLADEVRAALADRVPAHVLDQVLTGLLDADSNRCDEDLRELLECGVASGGIRTLMRGSGHLMGVRAELPARVASRARLYASAYRFDVRVCALGPTIWLLLPQGCASRGSGLIEHAETTAVFALSRDLSDPRLAPAHRRSLDELLTLGQRCGWTGLAQAGQLATARRVEALLDLAARQPELLEGQLDVLLDLPAHRILAETLDEWFACNQDAVATAEAMHLHVNTVRYRLRRAQEVAGLDMADRDQRLLAELRLRLWRSDQVGNRAASDGDVRRAEA